MASTNKTAHIELSQYVANDKPTYLGDYNADMQKIDSAVNGNKVLVETAQTTADTAIANAENAQNTANTAVTNSAQAQATANLNASNIGVMTNLETIDKTSLVNAINEVNENLGDVESAINDIVVDNMTGSETSKAPSVQAVKQRYDAYSLFTNETGSTSNITLSDSVENYEYVEVFFRLDIDNVDLEQSIILHKPNNKRTNLQRITLNARTSVVQTFMSMVIEEIYFNGSIINRNSGNRGGALSFVFGSTGNVSVNTNDVGVNFKIVKVIGYKN